MGKIIKIVVLIAVLATVYFLSPETHSHKSAYDFDGLLDFERRGFYK